MDLGLDGRVAVVAASSRGLGRGSALALSREGITFGSDRKAKPVNRKAEPVNL